MNAKNPGNSGRAQPIPGYEILDRAGSGGMGTIYRARQISMNRIVALKVLKKSKLRDPLPLDRLRREALLIARMDHPNIVRGIDMGETDRYYFFAMEFIEGRSVQSIIDLHGAMDELESARIVRDVAQALHYAFEQKLTHRDIKPGNILISNTGQTKLADLGLAKGESDLTLTQEGSTLGTPQYISPEQARTPQHADIRSDIYSLGATFYQMVTGRMPFEGESMAQVLTQVLFERPLLPETARPGLHQGTSRVISKMMAKDPSKRYQTPSELLDDLDVLIEGLRDGSKSVGAFLGMTWNESQRRYSLRFLYGLSAALAIIALAVVLIFSAIDDEPTIQSEATTSRRQLLESEYDAGVLNPLDALDRVASLRAKEKSDGEAELKSFRERILSECRDRIELMFEPGQPVLHRALLEGGLLDIDAALAGVAEDEARNFIGGEINDLPPELEKLWKRKLSESSAYLHLELEKTDLEIKRKAEENVTVRALEIESMLSGDRFAQAWNAAGRLEDEGPDLYRSAAENVTRKRAVQAGIDQVDVDLFLDNEQLIRFDGMVKERVKALKDRIEDAASKAHHIYLTALKLELEKLLAQDNPAVLDLDVNALIQRASDAGALEPPELPVALQRQLPEKGDLEKEFESRLANRKKELKTRHEAQSRISFIEEIDKSLAMDDFAGANRGIETAAKQGVLNETAAASWRRRIEGLKAITNKALESIDTFNGLGASLKTRTGVVYEGTIRSINGSTKSVSLSLPSGRTVNIPAKELHTDDLLVWAGKSMVLNPSSRGLYAYYRGDRDIAALHLKQADDFPEAAWYLERIEHDRNLEENALAEAEHSLDKALDQVELAISNGDWAAGLSLMIQIRDEHRATPAWGRLRRKRVALEEKLADLQNSAQRQEELNQLFTVPVTALENGNLRAVYSFDTADEMNDFDAFGNAWRIADGALTCGLDDRVEKRDFYHNQVGVRFGKAFDFQSPMTVSFTYRPPAEGEGPVFIGISFFGGCLGIRSFARQDRLGQVNFWNGDLDEYEDYFFVPDLGENNPRKGKMQPFGFSKGERYRIQLIWLPRKELLLRIDGSDIYRIKAFKPTREGIEIKTFSQAVIGELTIEGKIRYP